jgi:hypothetical protein
MILTQARNRLVASGRIVTARHGRTPWFHLADTSSDNVQEWLAVVEPVYLMTQEQMFLQRLGPERAAQAQGRCTESDAKLSPVQAALSF